MTPIETAPRSPLRAIRPVPHWRWGAAIAAGLLLGIALDRAVVGSVSSPTPATTTLASRAPIVPKDTGAVAPPASPATDDATRSSRRETSAAGAAAPRTAPAPHARPHELASTAPVHAATPVAPVAPDGRAFYRGAATQTLVQAEVLLTAYRRAQPGERDQESMRQTARWSREVLSSTRLLLDSPAGRDPQLHQLLTDLEFVLAQIVQLSGAPLPGDEREMIERAMHDRDLIPRLRSALPAGAITT